MPIGSGSGPPNAAPSADVGGSFLQDPRLQWNLANSSTGAQVIGWYTLAPLIDEVPATLGTTSLAAAQVPVVNTPMTLVSTTGAGITVSTSAFTALPSGNVIPSGALYIDGLLDYIRFGTTDYTCVYDPTVMISRCLAVQSVGNDSGCTMSLVGYDVYGYVIHDTITMGSGSTVNTTKAFKVLTSATVISGTLSGSNVSIGCSDIYGMPIQCARASMIWGFWNNLIMAGAGTFTAAVTTSPATALTGDVRGTYLVGSGSNGTKRLTLHVMPDPNLMASQNMTQGVAGVTQF
jgi:hypothetical protein